MSRPGTLDRFAQEVLRWNESINLVSRRDARTRVDHLIEQCRNALIAWGEGDVALAPTFEDRDVLYIDLGSGGGFPAVIWHELVVRRSRALRTIMVEPRDKRAWFLERVARGLTAPRPEVLAHRWGEAPAPRPSQPESVIVSLKALKLTDGAILAGLAPFLESSGGLDLTIARFHPEDQIWSEELLAALQIPEAGTTTENREWAAESVAAGLVEARNATLVVSRYRFERR